MINILNSELAFREYVTLNIQNISKVIIFEDTLDETIYFYCFTIDSIIATKEPNSKNFDFYTTIYEQINKNQYTISHKEKVLKMIKNN